MSRRPRFLALSAALTLSAACLSVPPLHAQDADEEAQIAEVVRSLSPVPPDIRMPTGYEMTRIAQESSRLRDPSGSFFRLAAHANLVELLEQNFGPDHPLTGQLLLAHARQLIAAQEYAEAEAKLERAEAILAARLPQDDLSRITAGYSRIGLLDALGRHLEQFDLAEKLAADIARYRPDDEGLAIDAADNRAVAVYRLGRYPEAVALGAEVLERTAAHYGGSSGRMALALTGQVLNLLAAGRLAEAEALLASRSPMAALSQPDDRLAISSLHRAAAAILEAKLDYDGARAEFAAVLAIADGSQFKRPDAQLNPDYGTARATRAALDMARLLYRKHHVLGLVQPDWMAPVWLKLDIEGTEHLRWTLDVEAPWRIGTRLEAMAARNLALHNQRSGKDLDLAEGFWLALLDYTERGTGEGSVASAEVRVELAENHLRNYRPFAAQDEAQAARAVLAAALGENHPATLRAESVAAIALARQGRRDLAATAIDAALEKAWAAGEQSKSQLLDLLRTRDTLLRLERDPRMRLAFWDTWGPRTSQVQVHAAFGEVEKLMQTLLQRAQASTDTGECPSAAEAAQIREAAAGLRIDLGNGGEPYIPPTLLTTALLAGQAVAETLACGNADPDGLFEFLRAQLNTQGDAFSNESGAAMVARYDRWAKLLIRDPEFGRSKERTELAMIFLARAESIAERQIAIARDGAGVADDARADEARQRQVLAGEGVGLDYRYALETRLEANWRFARAQEGLGVDDPQRLYGAGIMAADGFEEAFAAAQLLRLDGNSQALALASARAAAPDPQLRAVVAEYQSLSAELFRLLSAGGDEGGALSQAQARHAELAARIARDFPEYYRFAAPEPLRHAQAADALDEGEGLLTIMTVGADVYVFALTPTSIGPRAWHRVEGGAGEVEDLVRTLRCDLDPIECGENASVQTRGGESTGEVLEGWEGYDFDRNAASELYRLLIAPVASVFEGGPLAERTERLYVVTSGAASALPLSVLLTEEPDDGGYETTGPVFRDAPWLANRFDLAYLPAVSDLANPARAASRGSGFVGYGDPALDPAPPRQQRGKRGASLFVDTRAGTRPLANPRALMDMKSLPGAEAELAAVAALFPGSGRVVTKGRATEPRVKSEDGFAGAEVILFSTHGVLPDARAGIAEAGLVFTPPGQPTSENDGLLSASEAAALDFTSDLLVLSACNTATEGSFEGADSLSGLARSFIFAGARSVYASHWRVSDDITKELMLIAIRIGRDRPELSRSEALRQAMRAIRTGVHEDGSQVEGWNPDWSHPSAWAPFVAITSG